MENIIIAAVSKNNIIGAEGALPWKVPSELKHFKLTTLGKMVVMGRKTADSVGFLPSRINVVLTSAVRPGQISLNGEQKYYIHTLEDLIWLKTFLRYSGDIMIAGGYQIYSLFLKERDKEKRVDKILLSRILEEYDGDTEFPKIPKNFTLSSIINKEGFNVEEYINVERN